MTCLQNRWRSAINGRRTGEIVGKSLVLDAGPLQTIFVLHYIEEFNIKVEAAAILIREVCPSLEQIGQAAMGRLLSYSKRRHYTQLALGEALRFRDHSPLKRWSESIRRIAPDAIRSESLTELHEPADTYLLGHMNLISIVGLTDALHIHLLEKNPERVLITSEHKNLWQYAGEVADRIFRLDHLLLNDAGLS